MKLISSDLGTFEGHTQPQLYEDDFDRSAVGFTPKGDAAVWKDYGTTTRRQNGSLIGGRGVLSIVETVDARDVMVSSANARSDAEAGLVLRFQDPDQIGERQAFGKFEVSPMAVDSHEGAFDRPVSRPRPAFAPGLGTRAGEKESTMKVSTIRSFLAGPIGLAVLVVLLSPAQAATYSLADDFSYAENRADSTWSFRLDDGAHASSGFSSADS